MLVLQESTTIRTTAEAAYRWFGQLEQHYRAWHPDHINCRWVKGARLRPGAILEIEENLHGKAHRLRIELLEVQPDRLIRYHIAPGLDGSFCFLPTEAGVTVLAELRFGWELPLLPRLLDPALHYLFRPHLAALRRHMHEEGLNLRTLLES